MVKGLYIHIPFCDIKCPYCDFTSFTAVSDELFIRYINALKKELGLYSNFPFRLKTVYLGGGTPSILPAEYITDLLEYIKGTVETENSMEISIEVNPANYRTDDFIHLKEGGVNRVSIGAQSFLKKNLERLGRNHLPEDTVKTVESAISAGIKNINLDMIYGIPCQLVEEVVHDLEMFTSLPVKHISAYMLTPYDGTRLGSMVQEGKLHLPEDMELYNQLVAIDEYLSKRHFKRYEISNWAVDGFRCIHNSIYWKRDEFLGIGVSAWSFYNKKRTGNTKNLRLYLEMVEEGKKPVSSTEVLDEKEVKKEKIILGLRLAEGIPVEWLKEKMDTVEALVEEGYGKLENGRFSLTLKGVMVSNSIMGMLT